MDIKPHSITIRELYDGYLDDGEAGVAAYDGRLDVRPPYQREFIYGEKERTAVISTVRLDRPLNLMYWSVREDEGFEVIDGQQRTLSICQYIDGDFSHLGRYFDNLQPEEQEQILNYELSIFRCTGASKEKLDWFETINIAGKPLTQQELRNAVFHGSWTSSAKRYFAKSGCPAIAIGSDYLSGKPIRQDFLEDVLQWVTDDGDIRDYMGQHQHDRDARELFEYFQTVIEWVEVTFTTKRSEMKGVSWGLLYNRHGKAKLNPVELESRVEALMGDDEVERKKGIYAYILDDDESHLSLRQFSKSQKRTAFTKQKGVCQMCQNTFSFEEMHGDHIKPWSKGGKSVQDNCQMLCAKDNLKKSAIA